MVGQEHVERNVINLPPNPVTLGGVPPHLQSAAVELIAWWTKLGASDLEMLIPKAIEYSAHDLTLTGDAMAWMFGLEEIALGVPTGDNIRSAELTCWFYLLSKVMRAIGAVKDGNRPSDDTLRDVRVYATMIQRIRDTGSWPGWLRGKPWQGVGE